MPLPVMQRKLKLNGSIIPTRCYRINTQIRCPFHAGDWNAKVGRQETPGLKGKFGLGVQNEAGQRLSEFYQENALVTANTVFRKHKRNSTHGHHQMVNTKIRLMIFFAVKDAEALYSQQNQDWG